MNMISVKSYSYDTIRSSGIEYVLRDNYRKQAIEQTYLSDCRVGSTMRRIQYWIPT